MRISTGARVGHETGKADTHNPVPLRPHALGWPTMNELLLEAVGLVKTLGGKRVVDGIDLYIDGGWMLM